jgi:hypothetical protein
VVLHRRGQDVLRLQALRLRGVLHDELYLKSCISYLVKLCAKTNFPNAVCNSCKIRVLSNFSYLVELYYFKTPCNFTNLDLLWLKSWAAPSFSSLIDLLIWA